MNPAQTDDYGASRGSLKSYAAGFVLSIILTVLAFGLVIKGTWPHGVMMVCIVAAAVVQMVVHLHYFLHLDTSSAARWNVLALLFSLLIMFLFVGGSLWIMYNLNYRMM